MRICRANLALTLLISTSTLGCGFAAAQGSVDQQYRPSPNNGLEITSHQRVTQTFTGGWTGMLASVDLVGINHHRGVSANPLIVSIVSTTDKGVPTMTKLASVILPPAALPTKRGVVSVDFRSANLRVTPGLVLGICLESAGKSPRPTYAWAADAPGGAYSEGSAFIRETQLSIWDMGFRVHLRASNN